MPTKAPDPEEAAVNAELTAAHAEKAAAEAEEAERKLAEATKEDPKAKLCPTDNAEMTKHGKENPFKANCWHCDVCGVCYMPDGKTPR